MSTVDSSKIEGPVNEAALINLQGRFVLYLVPYVEVRDQFFHRVQVRCSGGQINGYTGI